MIITLQKIIEHHQQKARIIREVLEADKVMVPSVQDQLEFHEGSVVLLETYR